MAILLFFCANFLEKRDFSRRKCVGVCGFPKGFLQTRDGETYGASSFFEAGAAHPGFCVKLQLYL